MLTNLFSMFDTHLYFFSPIILSIIFFYFVLTMKNENMIHASKKTILEKSINSAIQKEFFKETSMMKNHKKNIKNIFFNKVFIFLFLMVFFVNYSSLYPYILSSTSHMSFNLTLTLNMWIFSVSLALVSSAKNFLAHLTPSGTPIALMSFMVLIETISNVIRPLTLAVRLMANMVAGHLLLTLLSKFASLSFANYFESVIPMLILGLLESGVSFIQAYVLTLLCVLYVKEAF